MAIRKESATIMSCKLDLWPTSRADKVPVKVGGDSWLFYQEVASIVVDHYFRAMVQ
jgi:hypothetical protein